MPKGDAMGVMGSIIRDTKAEGFNLDKPTWYLEKVVSDGAGKTGVVAVFRSFRDPIGQGMLAVMAANTGEHWFAVNLEFTSAKLRSHYDEISESQAEMLDARIVNHVRTKGNGVLGWVNHPTLGHSVVVREEARCICGGHVGIMQRRM